MFSRKSKWAGPVVAGLAIVAVQVAVLGAPGGSVSAASPHLTASTSGGDFGNAAVGSYIGGVAGSSDTVGDITLINNGGSIDTIDLSTGMTITGLGTGDWVIVATRGGTTGCPGSGSVITLAAGSSCGIEASFHPTQVGDRSVNVTITGSDNASVPFYFQGYGVPTLSVEIPRDLNFNGGTTLGTYAGPETFDLDRGPGLADDVINLDTGVSLAGPGAADYVVAPSPGCGGNGVDTVVLTGFDPLVPPTPSTADCTMQVFFLPGALGDRSATLTIRGSIGTSVSVPLSGSGSTGYYLVDSSGDVAVDGDAVYYGDAGGAPLNKPIVGMAATGDNGGYWLVASDGGIFNYGDASFFGSTGGMRLNKPIVGMAATPDAGGYWLVATDGGIFSYGDAPFFGSTGSIHLNKPIVGMEPTPDGGGYWLVASDGGIFSYGDARFYGSTGAIHLNEPIVGMAATPDGAGYWLVASDGGIFSYGDAQFYGSTGAIHLSRPIVGMAAMPDGRGYWFAAADGGLFNYGDAPYLGSGVALGLGPVVDVVPDGPPTLQASLDIPANRHAESTGPFSSEARHSAKN